MTESSNELPAEAVCGARHPIHYRSVSCTLPPGHGPVEIPGASMPFTHFDARKNRAWIERSPSRGY